MRQNRLQIGDVYEIETPAGLAYIQYTHDGGNMGALVRVLPGLFSARPDVAALSLETEMYFVYFTLKYALRDGLVKLVSNEPVPELATQFPIMRKQGGIDASGKTLNWYIGEGRKMSTLEQMGRVLNVTELTQEQEKLSIEHLWPYPVMVEELVRGWTPARAEEFRLAAKAERVAKGDTAGRSKISQTDVIEHYLYFREKRNAESASQWMRSKGWIVEVRMGADGENWLALGRTSAPTGEGIGAVRDELEKLARGLEGEYDGWGIPLSSASMPD